MLLGTQWFLTGSIIEELISLTDPHEPLFCGGSRPTTLSVTIGVEEAHLYERWPSV